MKKGELSKCSQKIMNKVWDRVRFKYPDGRRTNGKLMDRVVMHTKSSEMKDFFDVVDFIRFDVNCRKKYAIHFGYYIFENGRLKWGSQKTLTEEKGELLRLFKKAAKRDWLGDLIQHVK